MCRCIEAAGYLMIAWNGNVNGVYPKTMSMVYTEYDTGLNKALRERKSVDLSIFYNE